LAESVSAIAEKPQGLESHDSAGLAMLRSRALGLLGKFDHPEAHALLDRFIFDPSLGVDLVAGAATGVAFRGGDKAVKTLKKALKLHGGRGWAFRKWILTAFGSVTDPKAASGLMKIVTGKDANNEIVRGILLRMGNNETVKNSKQGAEFIRDFVLHAKQFNEQLKSDALEALEESKDNSVRPALEEIVAGSSSERLRTLAKRILKKNFPI